MTTRSLTPTKLRLLLSVTLGLILLISSSVFYLGYEQLSRSAIEVGKKVADARKSQNTLQELQTLKQELEANQEVINKAARIAADSQNYTYQNQIVDDLTAYAARSSMVISNITFSSAPAGEASGGATPAGLKKTTVTVALKNPVDYRNLLNFLHYIEQNLTKLKIANVTLTKNGADGVTTDVLNLEMYVR